MFRQTMKISMRAIVSNRMRSFLTVLGIVIGVMSVIILISIGQGTSSQISSSIGELGAKLLTANITADDTTLSVEDVEALKETSDSIDSIAPVLSSNNTVKNGSTTYQTSIVGVTPDFFDVQELDVQSGRLIVQSDLDWRTNIALIGTDVATEIFDSYDVIGETLSFGNRTFTIVGLLEETGSTTNGSDDDRILIPLTTAQRVNGETGITTFYAKAVDEDSVTRVENILEMYLLQKTGDEEGYSVFNQSSVLDKMSDVSSMMSMLLGGIAAISLLVGGIGIMNIMLVSVTERTREIGIRKAIGAKQFNILLQFLLEACILSVLGGLLGVLLALGGIQFYNMITASSAVIVWDVVYATIGFCAVIGIVFGSYPAGKAAKLLPIEALRYS